MKTLKSWKQVPTLLKRSTYFIRYGNELDIMVSPCLYWSHGEFVADTYDDPDGGHVRFCDYESVVAWMSDHSNGPEDWMY